MKNKTSQSGFTLIELIAVMVILGILAAVIIPRISTITSGAYESNVRNMYGLIKNEVNAQAIKAAMSGGSQGHLETYPDVDEVGGDYLNVNYFADLWVDDYDPDMWSSFTMPQCYVNTTNGSGAYTAVGAVLFMYHPHGRPVGPVVITEDGSGTPKKKTDGTEGGEAGASTSKEDIYWIYYAPRTSVAGAAAGRQTDSFVMAAWVDVQEGDNWTFGGSIAANGTPAAGTDVVIDDLSYMRDP
ncbi:uncharacterized protein METZ01_LOCUS355262 [marine metagenome]|uniref:Type II secretion system protein GspG C-terminal domain-containing protein n=1 Tax=marine metagenome TaxID=408172 RepID=A0A382RZR3_9ZZZZ